MIPPLKRNDKGGVERKEERRRWKEGRRNTERKNAMNINSFWKVAELHFCISIFYIICAQLEITVTLIL